MRILAFFSIVLMLMSCDSNDAAHNTMNVDANMAEMGTEVPTFPCDVIDNQQATEEECQDLRALDKDIKPGRAALDAPPEMVRGDTYEVTLVLDRPKPPPPPQATPATPPPPPAPDPGETQANASDGVGNAVEELPADVNMAADAAEDELPPTANEVAAQLPGDDTLFAARVGKYMTAELTGSGFDIRLVAPSDPMQVIPRGGQGRWVWEVVPTKGGNRRLTVKTQAVGIVDGQRIPLGNGDTAKDITVKVLWWQKLWDALTAAPAWIQLLTAILVALGALVAAWAPIRNAFRNRS